MLLHIRDVILRERVVNIQQLSRELKIDPSALQPMLDFWVHKGLIQRCHDALDCNSACFKCKDNRPVYYQIRE